MPTDEQSQVSTGLLRATFGFNEFRPGQAEAIGSLMDNGHTLVVMPTGAGKSLVYQYTAIARPGTAIVISPLISLMQDQVGSLARRRIPATYVNSSIQTLEQSARLEAMANGDYRLVYVAPERLRSSAFREALNHIKVSLLAVDEAHCISQWGHDFRPEYLNIADARRAMGDPLTAALTATATPRVRQDIANRLQLDNVRHVVTGFNRPNLTLRVISSRDDEGKPRSLAKAINGLKDGAAIVYVGTRRDAEEVAEFISSGLGKPAKCYHAGLPPDDRARVQDDFMSGRESIVVATNAFGMGIDRADVRMVVHYTIPSSLEEYYQEAGRAGRDGRPALCALLYTPHDRSLQEYFINNSAIVLDDLRVLHSEVRSHGGPVSFEDLSIATGLNQVAIRVGLSQLETSGIIGISAADGTRWTIESGDWNQGHALSAVGRAAEHLAAKREQLERIIDYAESNHCRRRIILDHFGDDGPSDASRCCDNCLTARAVQAAGGGVQAANPLPPTPETEQPCESGGIAHAILDAVHGMSWEIGVGKLAKLLTGSTSQAVKYSEYQKSQYFGRLSELSQDVVTGLIEQLLEQGYLKPVGGNNLPVLRLSPSGEAALASQSPIPLDIPRRAESRRARRESDRDPSDPTVEVTARLFADGLKPEEISERRRLAPITIYGHIAHLIADGRVQLDQIVPDDIAAQVRKAIRETGEKQRLSPVKAVLPQTITFDQIKCVFAADGLLPPPKPKQTIVDRAASPLPPETEPDAVSDYLSKSHPKPLSGPWRTGWSLGFHSGFAGSDWSRSGVGQLAYQLKYRGDENALAPLVREALDVIRKNPALADVVAIVPVPPSTKREFDPVSAFADALARELQVEVWPAVEKTRRTSPQKEMRTMAQKRANVRGAFAVRGDIKGCKLLLVDDLFDSGATLEEAHRVLKLAGASRVPVLTLTRTIHSDS